MRILRYAGIGSRDTPADMCEAMFSIGQQLGESGWLLRSGFADGADMAFIKGADSVDGSMEIFVPWEGFNGAPTKDPWGRIIVPSFSAELMELAERVHPNWGACKPGARKLHARNGCQVLGRDLQSPVDLVICWTAGGLGGGGTGQAIRIAGLWGIPVFDLFREQDRHELCEYVAQLEAETHKEAA